MVRWILSVTVLGCLATLVIAGCSGQKPDLPELTAVQGTVTLDGKPIADVTVWFVPAASTPGNGGFGKTAPDGRYTLTSLGGEAGIPQGRYDVTFSKFVMPDGSEVAKDVQPESVGARQVLPARYTNASTSRIEATVSPTQNTFDFSLTSR